MKTVFIIGNGPVASDYSELVDSSDFVVRFNEAYHYNKNNGAKADALCLTNTGAPARKFAKYQTIGKLPFIEKVDQIWFPRPSKIHPAQFWLKPFSRSTFERANYEKHIISRNNLSHKKIIRLTPELYTAACQDLAITPGSDQIPSTGYLGLRHVLQLYAGQKVKIILIGFGFSGNQVHPWEKEKNAVMSLQDQNLVQIWS